MMKYYRQGGKVSDDLYDLVGLDPEDHEAREAVADASALSDLITTLVTVRRGSGLTQRLVAERMGTTQSAVSELERVASDPHISTLQRFGRAVGARIAWKVVLDGGWTTINRHVSLDASVLDSDDCAEDAAGGEWRLVTAREAGISVVA
jgi:transcriptional regulator with XRE-family HTH domain